MERVQIDTIVQPNGRIVLENLPFEDGEKVEVTISETSGAGAKKVDPFALRGTEYSYEQPFDAAVFPEEWDALK